MKLKKIHFAITYIMVLLSLFGCSTQQKVYFIGSNYEDSYINATVLSAQIKDKITIGDNEIIAPIDNTYLIVDMEAAVKDGIWEHISDFVAHKNVESKFSFDQNLTNQLTGFDVLRTNNTENQINYLVFIIKSDSDL